MSAHRRAVVVLAATAIVCGAVGFMQAHDMAFTARRGPYVGSLMAFNRLGALVTVVLALCGLAGALSGFRALVAAAGAGFALAAVLQLVQAGRATNILGGRPSTFSFFLCMAVGLLVIGGHPAWRASG